jgi:hypothetical protein
MELRNVGRRGPKGLEVYPEKVGKPVTTMPCVKCLRGVPSVEWRTAQLTGEERVTKARSGGEQRKFMIQCTRCGDERWSTDPAVRAVANDLVPSVKAVIGRSSFSVEMRGGGGAGGRVT